MEELENLIDSIREYENRKIVYRTDVSKEFKEDVFTELYKKEFINKYYPNLF